MTWRRRAVMRVVKTKKRKNLNQYEGGRKLFWVVRTKTCKKKELTIPTKIGTTEKKEGRQKPTM